MRHLLALLAIVLTAGIGSPVLAGTGSARSLGILAFDFGDYGNAVKLFAESRSSQIPGSEAWGEESVSYALALARSGNLPRAAEICAEIEKYPALDLGVLKGEILLRIGQDAESEKVLDAVLAKHRDSTDPVRADALFLRAGCRFLRKNVSGAVADYSEIEKNRNLPLRSCAAAHFRKIYVLMTSESAAEAEKLLKKGKFRKEFPQEYEKLELFQLLRQNRTEEFRSRWSVLLRKTAGTPDRWMQELAWAGAEKFNSAGNVEGAVQLLNDGFQFASSEKEKKAILIRIADLCMEKNPAKSAAVLQKMLELFPNGDDRSPVMRRQAQLLYRAGEKKRAVELYETISRDAGIVPELRIRSALDSAVIWEEMADFAAAEQSLRFALRESPASELQQESAMNLGGFFFRRKNYAEAEKYLTQASKLRGRLAEDALYWLMQCDMAQKNFPRAAEISQKLMRSQRENLREGAEFFAARLLVLQKKNQEARAAYRAFVQRHPKSEYAEAARYGEGMLSMILQEYGDATARLSAFVRDYPASAKAPVALYHALLAAHFAKDVREASLMTLLDTKYADAPQRVSVRLQLAEDLKSSGDLERAGKMLDSVDMVLAGKHNLASEVYFAKAALAREQGDSGNAAVLFDKVLALPNSPCSADAAFLAGNLAADGGDYDRAIPYYERAIKIGGSERFGLICKGRIADCLFGRYSWKLQASDLEKALQLYRELSQQPSYPRIALSATYKLGRSEELAGHAQNALDAYSRVLYFALDLRKKGQSFDALWAERSAYSAVQIYRKRARGTDLAAALKMIELYRMLKVAPSDSLDRLYVEIQRQQKL